MGTRRNHLIGAVLVAGPNSCFGRNRKKYMICHKKILNFYNRKNRCISTKARSKFVLYMLKMIVRLKQLKEMNIKVALMYVIVCKCDLYECH